MGRHPAAELAEAATALAPILEDSGDRYGRAILAELRRLGTAASLAELQSLVARLRTSQRDR